MKPSLRRLSRWGAHAAGCLLAAALVTSPPAQDQPAVAGNSQDEELQIVKNVDAATSEFRIFRSGDKGEINRYIAKAYRLRYANPMELRPYLRRISGLEKGTVDTASAKDPVTGEPRYWIQVNAPEFQIPYVDALVAAYDVPGFESGSGDVKFSYRLKHRRASEVASHIDATVLSGDGSVTADDATNTIFVKDSPSDFLADFAHLQFYDIPLPQVDVEVKIVEVTELDQTQLGLDWDAWKTALGGALTGTYTSVRDRIGSDPELRGSYRSFDGFLALDATVLARFLNYLEDKGNAHTRVATRLNIANGSAGFLRSATQVPAYNYELGADRISRLDREDGGEPVAVEGEGLRIRIIPTVAAESTRLACEIAMRTPAGIDAFGQPIFSQQELVSQLAVEQGGLYALGTLRRKVSTKQRKGIPLLKEVPLLRYLVSVERTIERETELVVFVSPTWSAPFQPDASAMRKYSLERPEMVDGILKANPNLTMAPTDAALLQEYFDGMAASR